MPRWRSLPRRPQRQRRWRMGFIGRSRRRGTRRSSPVCRARRTRPPSRSRYMGGRPRRLHRPATTNLPSVRHMVADAQPARRGRRGTTSAHSATFFTFSWKCRWQGRADRARADSGARATGADADRARRATSRHPLGRDTRCRRTQRLARRVAGFAVWMPWKCPATSHAAAASSTFFRLMPSRRIASNSLAMKSSRCVPSPPTRSEVLEASLMRAYLQSA